MDKIIIRKLTKTYKKKGKKIIALENVSIDIPRGSVFGILGRNGAGKTTLIKILLGLISPDNGEIEISGTIPGDMKLKKMIGYLPEVSYLDLDFTANELLTFFANFFFKDKKYIQERIDDLLTKFELITHRDVKLSSFSKGMLQKISIIQALIHDPDILILDEPTSGLDPISQHEIRYFVKTEKEKGKTLILSSHYIDEIEELADHICIIHKGRVLRFGEKDKILQFRSHIDIKVRTDDPVPLKKYNPVTINEKEYALLISENEKNEFFDLVRKEGMEILEMIRVKEGLMDFFLDIIGEK